MHCNGGFPHSPRTRGAHVRQKRSYRCSRAMPGCGSLPLFQGSRPRRQSRCQCQRHTCPPSRGLPAAQALSAACSHRKHIFRSPQCSAVGSLLSATNPERFRTRSSSYLPSRQRSHPLPHTDKPAAFLRRPNRSRRPAQGSVRLLLRLQGCSLPRRHSRPSPNRHCRP